MFNLPNNVKVSVLSREKLWQLWTRLSQFDSLFVDDNTKDPEVFIDQFLATDGITLETEGGVMVLRKIIPGLKAEAHVAFWDKHLSPRTEMLKECIKWAFLQFDLQRIETFVAEYARALRRFIEEKLGFTKEGVLRKTSFHNGQLIDVHVYSILKEEIFDG